MKNHIKIAVSMLLAFVCVFACVSCNATANDAEHHSEVAGTRAMLDGSDESTAVAAADTIEDIENSYRVRFLYSYTAKMANSTGRVEISSKVVTVKSFYVPKDNPVVTQEIKNQIPNLTYRGFSFAEWYTEWDKSTQTGVEGTKIDYNSLSTISGDIDIYCSRGDLAGANAHWKLTPIEGSESVDEDTGETIYNYILTISGSGPMFDAQDANELDLPWYKHVDNITAIVIEDGITYVGNNSFNGLAAVKTITLADSITRIGEAAFQKCSITKFVAPEKLTRIEKNAFNTTKLNEVVLNDGLTALAERAFYGSNKIRTIVVPKTLKEIGLAAFHPGGKGSTNYSHALSKVYYGGESKAEFESIKVGLDNSWFADKPIIFYYSETKQLGNYWHYVEGEKTPIQHCFTLSYKYANLPEPIATIFVYAEPVYENGVLKYDANGQPSLKGLITADHINQQRNITYHNMSFSGFFGSNAIAVGDSITSDKAYTCDRGKILNHEGGILWALSNGVLTIYTESIEVISSKIDADIETRKAQEGGYVLTDVELDVYARYLIAQNKTTETYDQIKTRIIAAGNKLAEENLADLKAARLDSAYRMWDFYESLDATPLWTGKLESVSSITGVTVSEGVEYIGKYTFASLSSIKEILLPASLKGIDPQAFIGCTSLVSIYYNGNIQSNCSDLNKLTDTRATVYSKVESGTGDDGNYWMSYADDANKKIAWSLTDGKIFVGGDNVMHNFASADQAPWYAAKSKIKSVSFASNITSISTYAFYGYEGVMNLSIPAATKIIPKTAFEGTGIVTKAGGEGTKYDAKGMLIVDGHLIKVNNTCNKLMFETVNKIYNIADGALDDCTNIERVFIARTIQHINPNVFKNCNIKYIFVESAEAAWNNTSVGLDLKGASVYFKSSSAPKENVLNHEGKVVGTMIVENKYWTKCGNEYVIWGCTHVFGEYVNNENGTCVKNATESAKCTIGNCGALDTREIPDSTVNEHKFINDDGTESDTCVIPGCTAKKEEE
ncbi:MAG: hypothetical protein E7676_06180 [Ruminococcaceae bacterium]|nr:hypothetical protein [Oscillospiraceae bacterium]